MPFVKISDPKIIDLAAWHQVINVVNQHTDSINAITNNFGVQSPGQVDWNSDNNVVHEYNPGTEKVLYGRFTIDTATASYKNNKQFFYGTIPFVDDYTTVFSERPIVTATIQFGHSDIDALMATNHNPIVTLFAVTPEGFSYRVTRATSTPNNPVPLTGKFYISWQALGPK